MPRAAGLDEPAEAAAQPAFELTDELRELLGSVGVATLSVAAAQARLHRRLPSRACAPTGRAPASSAGRAPCGSSRSGPTCSRARAAATTRRSCAFDTVGPGEVLVIEARGERGTGTVGDVLALRAQVRGAAGIVTDGGIRDFDVVAALDIPTFSQGPHPSVLGRRHVPWEIDVTIACGGAAVRARRRHRGRRRRRHRDPARPRAEVAREAAVQEARGRVRRRAGRGGGIRRRAVPHERRVAGALRGRADGRATRQPMTAESKSQLAYRFIRAAHRRRPLRAGLPAGARPDRQGARRLGRARARGDPPARGRGARDLRAQRRRPGRAHQGDRVPAHHADARARRGRGHRAVGAVTSTPATSTGRATINERMRRTLDDFDPHRFTELNLEFHSVLFEECPNPHILDLVHRGLEPHADAARLLVQLRARARAGVGRRARPHRSTSSRRGRPARDRTRRPPPPHRDPRRGARLPGAAQAAGVHGCRHPTHRGRRHRRRGGRRLTTTDPHEGTHMTHHIPAGLPDRIRHYIDGEFVDSRRRRDVRRARPGVERDLRAGRGRPAGRHRPRGRRRAPRVHRRARGRGCCPAPAPAILHRIADLVEAQDARLAELETFDTGLPITQALGQAQRAAENFRFFADLIVAQRDDTYKVPGRQVNYVNRKPIGVAGLITPWNTPVHARVAGSSRRRSRPATPSC